MVSMEKIYNPSSCESTWYTQWLSAKLFHGAAKPGKKKPFSIVIPPPNVTGSLHMGHAVNNILQDVIIRYKKMTGYETLWMPGTDHGGIATQNVVEKLLLAEGKTRHTMGREKFLERMKRWRIETGDTILDQLKKLGCSCDWDRTCFTMDEQRNRAVNEAFRILFEKGLIYRGERMVQWCPRCHTALADIEVEHEEEIGTLWHIQYPFVEGAGGIVVATTRPETMLGDTAVAVHPDDERYKKIAGKKVKLPLTGRTIPIITDDFVDRAFGSGAVKVTPAHDPNDFEIGLRHTLPSVKVIDFNGTMTTDAGVAYAGLDRYVCRKKILEDLEKENLLLETKDHPHAIGKCYRCNEAIEPLVSKQWFLSVKEMGERAIKAAYITGSSDGKVSIIPDTWVKPYIHWLENLKDWCISRQIWWGHRIPLWYCKNYKEKNSSCKPIFGVEKPSHCPICKDTHLTQDPDVLDTWFSSALWPFSVFEWPTKTPELSYFYPTGILVTGHEILYLWVARMVKMSLALIDAIPFEKVLIHGMVRDKYGKKMSKSLGNVIDPLDVTKKYGTDALRFALVNGSVMGRDMQLADDSFIGARNFANKLWNVSRFVIMNLEGYDANFVPEENSFSLADHWIMFSFARTVEEAHSCMNEYNFAQVCRILYGFVWSAFCDWYVELIKPCLSGSDITAKKTAQYVTIHILDGILKMLHPIMPFITEEIRTILLISTGAGSAAVPGDQQYFDDLSARTKFLVETSWPSHYHHGLMYQSAEKDMTVLREMIAGIRNIRADMRVPLGKKINIICSIPSSHMREMVQKYSSYIIQLAKVENIHISESAVKPPDAAAVVVGENQIFIPLAGIIDIEKETIRLKQEEEKVKGELEFNLKKLENKNFITHAPAKEVEKIRMRVTELKEKLDKIKFNVKGLSHE